MKPKEIYFYDYIIKGFCPHCSLHFPDKLEKTAVVICNNQLIAEFQLTPIGLHVKTDLSFQLFGKKLTILAC